MKKEIKVMLNGAEKVVEFKEIYTRKIDREYNEVLFRNVNASVMTGGKDISINPSDFQAAQDYLLVAMSNLTVEDVDNLAMEDYQKVMDVVNNLKIPPKQTQAS